MLHVNGDQARPGQNTPVWSYFILTILRKEWFTLVHITHQVLFADIYGKAQLIVKAYHAPFVKMFFMNIPIQDEIIEGFHLLFAYMQWAWINKHINLCVPTPTPTHTYFKIQFSSPC